MQGLCVLCYLVFLNFFCGCLWPLDIHKITACTCDRTANVHKQCVVLLFHFLMGNWSIAQKSSSSRSSTLENLPSDLGNKSVSQIQAMMLKPFYRSLCHRINMSVGFNPYYFKEFLWLDQRSSKLCLASMYGFGQENDTETFLFCRFTD